MKASAVRPPRRPAEAEQAGKEMDRRLFATAELERRRLGQDLPDDLFQRLAAIKLGCGMMEGKTGQDQFRLTDSDLRQNLRPVSKPLIPPGHPECGKTEVRS